MLKIWHLIEACRSFFHVLLNELHNVKQMWNFERMKLFTFKELDLAIGDKN
jgi:hypothetical protein